MTANMQTATGSGKHPVIPSSNPRIPQEPVPNPEGGEETSGDPEFEKFGNEGVRGEVPGCLTGLAEPRESPPAALKPDHVDAVSVHGPLQVEKLEGWQESGRDAQDEAEEDDFAF